MMFDTIQKIYSAHKHDKKLRMEYIRQSAICDGAIHLYNWWQLTSKDGVWLSRLIQSMPEFQRSNKSVALLSVFGDRELSRYIQSNIKIFCTGENVKKKAYSMYSDHLLNDKMIDLSLGFEYFECERYVRFPLWLMYAFEPTFDEEKIRRRCAHLRFPEIGDKTRFASLIASHDDDLHIRSGMIEDFSAFCKVSCPGKLHHNDDSLKIEFADNKTIYLRQFLFNICPENANTMGYVTEKLFEAIMSGCIPVYWGSYNNPEPGILNPEAIIFWNNDGDNSKMMSLVEDLCGSSSRYEEFVHQPRLLPSAEECILVMMEQLKMKLCNLY